ncbi:MAG: TfoX/Sxy family protein [Chloroflexota bacterium]|nr:TfoX/Sxy family protein [Chloroflexota bacterium]
MPREMPKFIKTPPEIVAAFDAASPSRGDIERKTMFSYPALFVKGNMFAFTFGPKIAVRLGEAGRARAVKSGAGPFEPMPGRGMKEYVTVPPAAMKGAPLKKWIADGLVYADTLPVKTKAKPTAMKGVPKTSATKASGKKKT